MDIKDIITFVNNKIQVFSDELEETKVGDS